MSEKFYNLGLKCAVLMSDFYEWQDRYLYIKLMTDYLDSEITFNNFDEKFLLIWSANRDKEKPWEEFLFIINNFELNKFKGFSALTSKIMTDLEIVETNSFLEDYQITETEFKDRIKLILLEMKNKYSKFES